MNLPRDRWASGITSSSLQGNVIASSGRSQNSQRSGSPSISSERLSQLDQPGMETDQSVGPHHIHSQTPRHPRANASFGPIAEESSPQLERVASLRQHEAPSMNNDVGSMDQGLHPS